MEILNYEPISTKGKVLIDEKVFNELKKAYAEVQMTASVRKAKENYAKTGIKHDGDEALANLREKYVRKV